MAKRGPKPKPNVIKLADGNPGRRPLGPEDPCVDPLGLAPQGMQQSERDVWNIVRRECPWLKRADRLLVQDFCRVWVIKRGAETRLIALMIASTDHQMISALERTAVRFGERSTKIMGELGLTPTTRATLSALLEKPKEQTNPKERFFA